jgi:two-component system sensor histidine kinase MprB
MPGSGLGLAIVKKVVQSHGGLLRVEDTVPGGQPPGTSIYVLLPGRAVPVSGYPTDEADTEIFKANAATEPTLPVFGSAANSREQASVISVDSQSARAR